MYQLTLSRLVELWEQNHLRYSVMQLQDDTAVMISERGGRVLGPFFGSEEEGFFWLNPALAYPQAFAKFLSDGEWNLGGDRFWIAPEVQYVYQRRARPAESTIIQPGMDPGNFYLEKVGETGWRIINDLTLNAFNTACGQKRLHFENLIRPAANPLRGISGFQQLCQKVQYAGYEQVVRLQDLQPDAIMSSARSVLEIQPGGKVLIPISPRYEYSNHEMQPVGPEYQSYHGSHLTLRITGDRAYKTGYKAAHTTGRFGYLHTYGGRAYLMIRAFTNNPSALYFEEPPSQPGLWGASIFVYNDDGSFGGYGEMECLGQTIGGLSGQTSAEDTFTLWVYTGEPTALREIAAHLLGIEIEEGR